MAGGDEWAAKNPTTGAISPVFKTKKELEGWLNTPEGTRNVVVFDDSIVKIIGRE